MSNGTGWRRQKRFADALVLQCWPSRGITLTGIEVKVTRSDWMREFRDPSKADELRNWCAYWYLATPPGIVKVDEVPKTWGLYEIDGRNVTCAKKAPEQKTKPLDIEFIASMARHAASQQNAIRTAGHEAGYELARKRFDKGGVAEAEQKLDEERRQKYQLERERDDARRDFASLKAAVEVFEKTAGLPERAISSQRGYMGISPVGDYYNLARALSQRPIEDLADHFREALGACESIKRATKGAA